MQKKKKVERNIFNDSGGIEWIWNICQKLQTFILRDFIFECRAFLLKEN